MARHVLAGRPALQDPGGAGEEAELVDGGRQLLVGGELARLAGVADLGVDQVGGPGLDRVGELEQGLLPFRRGAVAPRLERGRGGAHGGVDVALGGDGCLGEDLAGARVNQVAEPAVDRVGVRPVDEVAQDLLFGHRGLPGRRR
ncbi:hypothetical protein Prum_051380 [Phytohabitans rumicis]|uniref:Uncharacterized protein n=1 Tax=Phytohabitans rumicis TaxID=1076125 RepID=A0A6V8LBN6_9ACTN|nr:hypothetical protein Prum_051380 [Phytohabitans rumicis]